MELFFYSCEKEAPFDTLYYDSGSSSRNKLLLISNHKQHIAKFETYKDRILDEAIGSITDKKILVPSAVKAIFLEWVKEKYGDETKLEKSVFNAKDFDILGADNLNHFIQEMNIENGDTPPSPIWKKLVKPVLLSLLIVSLIIAIICFYQNGHCFGKKPHGWLNIIRIPDRAIYINEKEQSQKTPVNNLKVPAGDVNIRIDHPDYGSRCAQVDLKPNESMTLGKKDFKPCYFQ
jgi:hypothetical protein